MTAAEDRQALNVSPYFFVEDLVRAAEYYRDKLGFHFDRYWGEPPCFVMVRRDRVQFMLRSGIHGGRPQPNRRLDPDTWDAYIYVRDADGLHAECSAGAAPRSFARRRNSPMAAAISRCAMSMDMSYASAKISWPTNP